MKVRTTRRRLLATALLLAVLTVLGAALFNADEAQALPSYWKKVVYYENDTFTELCGVYYYYYCDGDIQCWGVQTPFARVYTYDVCGVEGP